MAPRGIRTMRLITRPNIVLLLCAAPLCAAEPRVDQYGDPLPEGAIARMGTMRLRHPGLSFEPPPSFAPDGRAVVTVGGNEVRLWDAATGKLRFTFGESDKRIFDARHTPDGKEIAVACEQRVLLLNAETGKVRRAWPSERSGDRERGLFISPDGKTLVVIERAGNRNETAA